MGCLSNPGDIPLFKNTLAENPLNHVTPDAPPVLYKSHGDDIDFREGNNLILLTRSPTIVIRRQIGNFSLKALWEYIKILNIYDEWEEPKLLIKYDDLITKPEQSVLALARFLKLDEVRAHEFLQNYNHHKKTSITLYSDPSSGIPKKGDSATKGNPITNSVSKIDLILVKLFLSLLGKNRYQNLFDL